MTSDKATSQASRPAPHVVVIGGGFAGIYAVRELKQAPVRVTVIDRRNYHLFQPMLYQVATAGLNPADITAPIRSIVRRQRNTEVVLGEVSAVDTDGRRVALSDGTQFVYDYLLVCTGARHSYFGHDDWEQIAPGLKGLEDALEIRRRLLTAFERAEREPDPVKRQALLTFVIVGGGPTGVEMAGAVAEIRSYALRRDFRHIDPREATVVLLEGTPRLLSAYAASLSEEAKRELRALGVVVRTETFVTDVRPGVVEAAGWTIPTHTVIWAAGNVASPLLKSLRTPLDRQGRAIVERDCSIPGHPEVFVLGDAALFEENGRAVPAICPAAIQMGRYAAATIRRELAGKPREPFSYWDKGQLAVIGRGQAVADIGRLHFGGFIAWLLWIFIHIWFLIGFRNRLLVMIEWAWAYITYQRGARLITEPWCPESATQPAAAAQPEPARSGVP